MNYQKPFWSVGESENFIIVSISSLEKDDNKKVDVIFDKQSAAKFAKTVLFLVDNKPENQ